MKFYRPDKVGTFYSRYFASLNTSGCAFGSQPKGRKSSVRFVKNCSNRGPVTSCPRDTSEHNPPLPEAKSQVFASVLACPSPRLPSLTHDSGAVPPLYVNHGARHPAERDGTPHANSTHARCCFSLLLRGRAFSLLRRLLVFRAL